MSKIIIVDEDDNVIGAKERSEAEQLAIYRVSILWLMNSNNEVLIAQRHKSKSHPEKWGPAVGGTVEVGETYESNIEKEIKEELGVDNICYRKGPKLKIFNKIRKFGQVYIAKIDLKISDLHPQADEVAQLKWVKLPELIQDVQVNPGNYTPAMCKIIEVVDQIK
jgi:isopentenyldiphosphate isomerase